MRKRNLTEFGKEIKLELLLRDQTQEWLISQVRKKSGMFLDSGYLGKIMAGERQAPEIARHICEVLEIPIKIK